jgi:hypothetical protein
MKTTTIYEMVQRRGGLSDTLLVAGMIRASDTEPPSARVPSTIPPTLDPHQSWTVPAPRGIILPPEAFRDDEE